MGGKEQRICTPERQEVEMWPHMTVSSLCSLEDHWQQLKWERPRNKLCGSNIQPRWCFLGDSGRSLCILPWKCILEDVWVCSGCYNNVPPSGDYVEVVLKQQKFLFSQFWRWEAQDQGVSVVCCSGPLSPWLVNGHLLLVFWWSSLSSWLGLNFLFW